MITYICGSVIKYSQFPEEFWNDIDKCMSDGDEILLGNSDFDHRVYGRCRNKQYSNVSVMKESPKRRRSYSYFESLLLAYASMLRKCDQMIAVWDGESRDAFINIMLLLALHKKCRMYYLPSGKCIEIDSIDTFSQYVPEREGWTVRDIKEILEACGFEEQMAAYLTSGGPLPEVDITEIINRAPVSLDKKLKMLEKLQKKNNLNYEAFSKVSSLIREGSDIGLVKQEIYDTFRGGLYISQCIAEINWAQYWLKKGTYYLFENWYDNGVFIEKSSPVGLFRSLKNVMKYIELEEKPDSDEEEDITVDWWYRLEVWTDEYGVWGSEGSHDYDFYIYKGEICWFERLREYKEDNGVVYFLPEDREYFGGSLDLSFPTPFKLGDIVNIDCTPFGEPFHALIIEARHQFDCCMPQVLFKMPYTDRWALSSLKHKHFYKNAEFTRYDPVLSPLYRLRKVRDDELTEDDELLVKIGRELKDEATGDAFWRAFNAISSWDLSAEEVMKAWESVKK